MDVDVCGRMCFCGSIFWVAGVSGQFKTWYVRCVVIRYLWTAYADTDYWNKTSLVSIYLHIPRTCGISKPREWVAHTVISSGVSRALDLERYATNHGAGPMAPFSSSHSMLQFSHWRGSHVMDVSSLPAECILLQALWIRLHDEGPFHWLDIGYRRLPCPRLRNPFLKFLFPFPSSAHPILVLHIERHSPNLHWA